MSFVYFYKPSSDISITFNCKLNSSLNDSYFFWMDVQLTVFSDNSHITFLRYKQHITIWIVESFILHWCVECKQMDTNSSLQTRFSSSTDCSDSVKELCWGCRVFLRVPSQLIWIDDKAFIFCEITNVARKSFFHWNIRLMQDWRSDSIKPCSLEFRSCVSERSSRNLFCIESKGTLLRRVLR